MSVYVAREWLIPEFNELLSLAGILFRNTSSLGGFLERRGKAREEERFEACSSDGCGILLVMETPRCGRVEGFSKQEMSSGLAKDCIRAVQLLYFFVFGLDKQQAWYLVWR